VRQRLGDAGGISQFGVNLLRLPPGAWSAQRHWHSDEDEFVWVLSGKVMLIADEGEHVLRAGDCAAFPKGQPNGHHLVNKSDETAVVLEVGMRSAVDVCDYPDIDLRIDGRVGHYTRKDGTPYPPRG
jgi:uncharacterized cupin superfamily protein